MGSWLQPFSSVKIARATANSWQPSVPILGTRTDLSWPQEGPAVYMTPNMLREYPMAHLSSVTAKAELETGSSCMFLIASNGPVLLRSLLEEGFALRE